MRPYLLLALLAPFLTAQAAPVPSTYTYQGELRENGAPRNGTVDLRFRVYDLPTGGSQYNIVAVNDVPVSNGLFTAQVPLDTLMFFEGGEWWLSVEVREGSLSGAEPYVLLSPRQLIAAVPYATNAQAVGGLHTSDLQNLPGLSAYKRTGFAFKSASALGEPDAAFASLGATAPANGQLVFRARGHCRLIPFLNDTTLSATVAIGLDEFDSGYNVVNSASFLTLEPRSTPSSVKELELPFTAERVYSVTANVTRTAAVFGGRTAGAGEVICSGSLSAEFFPATL